ncbi:hypothetical protein QJS04_geneDACA021683 [Acorus gramineus]|uniref:Bifunctional inhibitor/plant lipid transfer protein/seed storage helical domain-containing protein n=1 Tax=Acorus gramineus TaxID=55184 RepID=A0AAV9A230_ACOGR|nr:hypothetical protein QJS04_geneDACA021683 [Acorus gramineus]
MEVTERAVTWVLILLVAMACVVVEPAGAVDCYMVSIGMNPCREYLTGQAAEPSSLCCRGVRLIHQEAHSTWMRQDTCKCLRQIAASHGHYLREEAAQALAGRCGVQYGIPFSRDVDCSR